MVELSMQNIKELIEMHFHQIYKLDVDINKEQLLEVEGGEGELQTNKVEEDLNLSLKKL